jgi:hypothetical protein
MSFKKCEIMGLKGHADVPGVQVRERVKYLGMVFCQGVGGKVNKQRLR